jgi:hypothetical protein
MSDKVTADELARAKAEVHARRMAQWPKPFRAWLLRLALGPRQFGYMLRSIRNDSRTPAARLVDIVVRQDAHEIRTEADWVKEIAKMTYHLPTPPFEYRSWWFRFKCALRDHGGIGNDQRCKRCGTKVDIYG